jgi:signal transduction histidine kinase
VAAVAARDVLPSLSTTFSVVVTDDAVGLGSDLPMSTPLGSLIQLIAAAGFLWAAILTRDIFRRDRSIGDAYLAVGLLFAAGAQVHVAFYPGIYPGIVTSGDVLRLIFDTFLLLGIYQEARQTFIEVRGANEGLVRLSRAEAEAAGLEERARLARELHDGLAQSLWLAKLYVGRLGAVQDLGHEAMTVTDALRGVVDTALAEAREAVMALRSGLDDPDRSFRDLLQRSADDFSDRFGVRVECSFADPFPALGSPVAAELLRITREAFTNIGKHSDATVARLAATVEDHTLTLRIRDNGRGFDPTDIEEGRVGIQGMRERAALIDARLAIESERSGGTTVTIDVGLPAKVAGAGST